MNRQIGLSVYPEQSIFEKDKQYLDLAKELGYSVVFTSILHLLDKDNEEKNIKKTLEVIKYANSIGYYTIVDVDYRSFEVLGLSLTTSTNPKPVDLSKCIEYGINCLRLDSISNPLELKMLSHNIWNIDIQLNMSVNDYMIDNLMTYEPYKDRISGSHNFYPLRNTGLSYEFFEQSNKKFKKYNLRTAAFVASHIGKQTVAINHKELPTLELQRDLSIVEQAKILFYSNKIDTVIIGNAYASKEELEELANLNRYKVIFDIKLDVNITEIEKNLINFTHFRRADLSNYVIRSFFGRFKFKDQDIVENNIKQNLEYGDIVIVNNNDPHYKGELHIILKDGIKNIDNTYNFVGKIKKEEYILLDYIKSWTLFGFNFIK